MAVLFIFAYWFIFISMFFAALFAVPSRARFYTNLNKDLINFKPKIRGNTAASHDTPLA